MISQNSWIEFDLTPDIDGLPSGVVSDVFPSAELDEFVLDVYVDGVLEFSEREPESFAVDFEPTLVDRTIRVEVREYGEILTCEVNNGLVQLQNLEIVRTGRGEVEGSLLDQPAWSVAADSPAEIANLAAIGTHGSSSTDFRLLEDAPVVVTVGPDQSFETSADLWDDLGGQSPVLPGPDERLIVTETAELSSTGGDVFVPEAAFGGRVSSVRLEVEIFLTLQSTLESGFVLRVDGQVVDSGLIDNEGRASVEVLIDEESWPRDATITLDLALHEAGSACDDARPFSGQMEVVAIPVGVPDSRLTVSDFPAVLLEGTPTLFIADGVSDHDVAVVSSALQAASPQRIVFADAESVATADLVIQRGDEGSIALDGNQLVMTLNDGTVEILQEDRFWVFNDDTSITADNVQIVPDEIAFVDIEKGPDASTIGDLSPFRIASFALLTLGVLAVLRLLWKNSAAASTT